MRSLVILLVAENLLEESIRLQRVFSEMGGFKINYQDRSSFAQFLVETNTCAKHFKAALRKMGFNVEVSEVEPTSMENCHDCQVAA